MPLDHTQAHHDLLLNAACFRQLSPSLLHGEELPTADCFDLGLVAIWFPRSGAQAFMQLGQGAWPKVCPKPAL